MNSDLVLLVFGVAAIAFGAGILFALALVEVAGA